MILVTIVGCELKEELEEEKIMRDKYDIVGLADGGYLDTIDADAKARGLGVGELFIVVNNIEVTR